MCALDGSRVVATLAAQVAALTAQNALLGPTPAPSAAEDEAAALKARTDWVHKRLEAVLDGYCLSKFSRAMCSTFLHKSFQTDDDKMERVQAFFLMQVNLTCAPSAL